MGYLRSRRQQGRCFRALNMAAAMASYPVRVETGGWRPTPSPPTRRPSPSPPLRSTPTPSTLLSPKPAPRTFRPTAIPTHAPPSSSTPTRSSSPQPWRPKPPARSLAARQRAGARGMVMVMAWVARRRRSRRSCARCRLSVMGLWRGIGDCGRRCGGWRGRWGS
jgi:hypothetical protein